MTNIEGEGETLLKIIFKMYSMTYYTGVAKAFFIFKISCHFTVHARNAAHSHKNMDFTAPIIMKHKELCRSVIPN